MISLVEMSRITGSCFTSLRFATRDNSICTTVLRKSGERGKHPFLSSALGLYKLMPPRRSKRGTEMGAEKNGHVDDHGAKRPKVEDDSVPMASGPISAPSPPEEPLAPPPPPPPEAEETDIPPPPTDPPPPPPDLDTLLPPSLSTPGENAERRKEIEEQQAQDDEVIGGAEYWARVSKRDEATKQSASDLYLDTVSKESILEHCVDSSFNYRSTETY